MFNDPCAAKPHRDQKHKSNGVRSAEQLKPVDPFHAIHGSERLDHNHPQDGDGPKHTDLIEDAQVPV